MSSGCKCGSNCSCGSGCSCEMDVEKSTSIAMVEGVAPVIVMMKIEGAEKSLGAEGGNGCKCGSSCSCDPCRC